MITTSLISALEASTETQTEVTNAIEGIIANAVSTTAKETGRLSSLSPALLIKSRSFALAYFRCYNFLIGLALSKIILRIFTRCLNRANVDITAVGFLRSLLKVLLYTIDFIITLSILNIPMTSIIAVISAAGLAIGLALQNSLSNLAGGFIILFSKPFKSGDYVETNAASGTVESIGILYIRILTADNKTVYIPNGKITDSTIVNFSEQNTRRVDFEFGISYSDDIEKAKSIILKLASEHPMVLEEPEPFARLGLQAEDSLQITVRLWTETENYWQVKFDLTEQVNQAFIDNNVTIPFRQIDVHIIKEQQ